MAINSTAEYVDFFVNLNMPGVSLLSFANNERMSLKHRLKYKNQDIESIKRGISILEGLIKDISIIGERQIITRYVNKK